MKKIIFSCLIILIGLSFFSCSGFTEEIRGSIWYGDVSVFKDGFEGYDVPLDIPLTIYLHAHGAAEVHGIPNFTPYLSANWNETIQLEKGLLKKRVEITGDYAAANYLREPAYVMLQFERNETEMVLIEGYGQRFTASKDKASVYEKSTFDFTPIEGEVLEQGLYHRDLEDTKWVADITFAAPANDLEYSYSKDREKLMARVEILVYPQSVETKMRLLITALTPNWKNPKNNSEAFPVGQILYDPAKFKNWSVTESHVIFTSTLDGDVSFIGVPNNITDFSKLNTITCLNEDITFKVTTLNENAPADAKLVVEGDLIFKKDPLYTTSYEKY